MKHMRTLDEVLADLRKAEKEYEKKLQEFEIKRKKGRPLRIDRPEVFFDIDQVTKFIVLLYK